LKFSATSGPSGDGPSGFNLAVESFAIQAIWVADPVESRDRKQACTKNQPRFAPHPHTLPVGTLP